MDIPPRIALMCRACGATAIAVVHPERVEKTDLIHGEKCPFCRAAGSSLGEAWIREHGYPVRIGVEK